MSRPENPGNISQFDRRQLLRGAAAVAAGAAAASVVPAGAAQAGRPPRRDDADLIIHNGRVLVLDKHFRTAEAVAIRDGKVLAVGGARDVRRYMGRRTEVLDAGGGTVLPGINDTHLHISGLGLAGPPYTLNVNTATIEDLVAIIRDAVAQAPSPDSWIRGSGWQELILPRPPTAADMDPVSGNHPVILRDFSGHNTSVNSVVLRMAGITRDTVPPAGGVIVKDATGEPNGVLRETAQRLVSGLVPPRTPEEISEGFDRGMQLTLSRGITSATQPGHALAQLNLFVDKARAGALPVRMNVYLSAGGGVPDALRDIVAAYREPSDVDPRILRVIGVKVGADGIPRGRTAWMHKPYLDGTNGSMTIAGSTNAEQVANLHEIIQIAVDAGLQVATHSCGDATTDAVVDGHVRAIRQNPRRRYLRHSVHHCNFPSARTLRTMARYGIAANLNAEILYLQGRVLEEVVGPELAEYQWPYRSALDAGVPVTSGSDAPVVEGLWLNGVKAAVLREASNGSQAGTAERITVPEALATYTRTGAWLDRAEAWKGTLERGKVADVCIVDGDLLRDDPHTFSDMQVTNTLVGGQVVYERASQARAAAATTAAAARTIGPAWDDSSMCCCDLADQLV